LSKQRVKGSKYSSIIANNICDLIAKGVPLKQAAKAVNISEQTLHNWRKKKEEFGEMVEQALGVSEVRLISEISTNEDWRAKAWILERRFPDRWSKRERIEMSVEHSSGIDEVKAMFEQTNNLLSVQDEDQPSEDNEES
jgi:transposase